MRIPENWQYQLEKQRDKGNDWMYQGQYLGRDFYGDPIDSGCYYVIDGQCIPELMLMDYLENYIICNEHEIKSLQESLDYMDDNNIDYSVKVI